MSAHDSCRRVGKFDCDFDEDAAAESGIGDGDVESPVAWFAGIDLYDNEFVAINHYGTRWLIVREFNSGQVTVETFETKAFRDERLADLADAYGAWLAEG